MGNDVSKVQIIRCGSKLDRAVVSSIELLLTVAQAGTQICCSASLTSVGWA